MNNFGLKFHHLGMATNDLKESISLLKKPDIKLTKFVQIKIIMLKTQFVLLEINQI